jgi:cytochrome c556
MFFLKQSTAVTLMVGPFLDSTDGVTAESALTITQADVRLSKNGAAFAQKTEVTSLTHDENGYYTCLIDATDTGTLGRLVLAVSESGALPVWHEFLVVPANVWDSLVGNTDKLQADIVQAGGSTVAAGAIPNAAAAANGGLPTVDANNYVAGIPGTKNTFDDLNDLSAAQVNAEVDSALDTAVPGVPTADSINERVKAIDDLTQAAGGGDLAAILADVAGINGDAMRGTDSAALASVATEARLAELDAGNLPTDVAAVLAQANKIDDAATTVPASATTGSLLDRLANKDGSKTYSQASDALEALRDRGDAAWVTGGGGAITQILDPHFNIPNPIDLANTATWRIAIQLVNAVDDLPSGAEITPGTISIDRKAQGATSWSAVVTDAACSEAAGVVYYDEVFDSGTGYADGDMLRITFKSISVVADANTHEIVGAGGAIFYSTIVDPMRGTDSAALASVATEGRLAELDAANLPTDVAAVLAQANKIDDAATTVPASATTGSLLDRLANKDANKTYAQLSDSLEGIADGGGGGGATAAQVWAYASRTLTAWLGGAKICTITVEDGDTNPIGSCPYVLKNSGGQTLQAGTTHASTGVFVANLDEANDYSVTLGPLGGYSFGGNPFDVDVGAAASQAFTLTGAAIAAPATPGDATLCNCYVDMREVEGGQLLGAGEGTMDVTGIRTRPDGNTEILTTNVAAASTDGSGRASINVVRGAVVEITLTWPTGETDTRTVTVPDAGTYDVGVLFQS